MASKKQYREAVTGLVQVVDYLSREQGIRDNYRGNEYLANNLEDSVRNWGYRVWWEGLVEDVQKFTGQQKREHEFEAICGRLGVKDEENE